VYDNALSWELRRNDVQFERQVSFVVHYREHTVGRFTADYVVEGSLILELKALSKTHPVAVAQVHNYLKASQLQVALLLNFGNTKLEIKRVVKNLKVERSI
jgi:GxxExxY protein